jgi:hypothetical protein
MRITDAGNVGIGTSSPTNGSNYKAITVNGTTGSLIDFQSNGTTGGRIQTDTTYPGMALFAITNQPMVFGTNGTERMRIDSAGDVGIGTSSPSFTSGGGLMVQNGTQANLRLDHFLNGGFEIQSASSTLRFYSTSASAERMRIDSSGNLLVGKTSANINNAGSEISSGLGSFTRSGDRCLYVNRLSNDGVLVLFDQDGTSEGNISVSGSTVSYNGGHLSRWAQTTTAKDESLVKGTVLSNLDEMNVYTDAEGNPVQNEQLNKVKVSDVEGDANVAGVFVNWTHDDAHNVDEINMAMTGDMIIRIAAGTTVQRGDLLMSAGDGTAKPQGDDIVRSKTIAKVTSIHVTCTYADGSYCVPCVLMAC